MWVLVNQSRLKLEREKIASLEADAEWLISSEWGLDNASLTLNLIADLQIGDEVFPIRMEYPAVYPSCPPSVFPREAGVHWSSHQYANGELCLEWGPDTWHEDITGAQVLKSAYKLLNTERSTDSSTRVEAPSRHAVTIGQELRSSAFRLYVEPSLNEYLSRLPDGLMREVKLVQTRVGKSYVQHVEAINISDQEWSGPFVCDGILDIGMKESGRLYNSSLPAESILEKYSSISILNEQLLREGFDQETLFTEEEIASSGKNLLIVDVNNGFHLFCFLQSKGKSYCIKYSQINSYQSEVQARIPVELSVLDDKRIGIVGLGSVGSKIAISIARTGCKKFLLIDDDILMSENICRNALDWSHVGHHKVNALSHQLSLISKEMDVRTIRLKLSGQEASSSVDSALNHLGKCDIIIDATADPNTFNQLAGIAYFHNKPLVWCEIFAGGIGGLIARSRPSIDPHPQQMRHVFNQYTQICGGADDIRATRDYSAEHDDGEVIVASDGEVSAIASHCVNLVIDSLIDPASSKFPYSMYLIGLSQGWVFDQPFKTIPIGMPDREVNQPDEDVSEEDKKDHIQFLTALIKDDNESSPS